MKKTGLIVAVEMDSVLAKYGTPAEMIEEKAFRIYVYKSADYVLYVLNSGAGEIAAAAGTQYLISKLGAELIVNFGVVGGLTTEMGVSKTCIVENVVHYDFDGGGFTGTAVGRYIELPDIFIPTTASLVEKALAAEPTLRRVNCASGDKFVEGAEKKGELRDKFSCQICDMESAGIALTCLRNGVPCLLIKTVSDGMEGGAEEFAAQIRRSSEICMEITDKLIRQM